MSEDDSNPKSKTSFPTAIWTVPNRTKADPPPPNTFELGLVMAGAVSAGAYTAGVIDFLVEALDEWETAKADGRDDAPKHTVRVPVMAGTSAGGMTTAILAAWSHRKFPHVRETESHSEATGNPFFDAWVNRIDISHLLIPKERAPKEPPISLLNGDILEDIVSATLDDAGKAPKAPRAWFAQTTRVILTATNLRGIPYWEQIRGPSADGYGMNNGRDYQTFALAPPASQADFFDDEIPLLTGAIGSNLTTWGTMGDWARATGAFPMALPPVSLTHKPKDLYYRVVERDDETPGHYIAARPFSKNPDANDPHFLAVDGGVLNNEPLNLARQVLAGGDGRNPRKGDEANRATLLIDPFPAFEANPPPDEKAGALWTVAGALLGTWKGSSRFSPEDLMLSRHDEVYSRFQIAPVRGGEDGLGPLASGLMGGFSGFLHREYRRHDYLLGRRNAQRMLTQHLVLPETNPLFKRPDGKIDPAIVPYAVHFKDDPKTYYPIIPVLIGSPLSVEEPRPAWPAMNLVNVDAVARNLAKRVDVVARRSLKSASLSRVVRFLVTVLGLGLLKTKVREGVRDYLAKTLKDGNLRDL